MITTQEPPTAETTVAARRPVFVLCEIGYAAIGLVLLGLVGLFVARGLLYGVVDDGPYTDSWGGPTLAGAWAVHFAIALAAMVPTLAAAAGVLAMHRRVRKWLRGGRLSPWFFVATVAGAGAVAIFLTAYVRQL